MDLIGLLGDATALGVELPAQVGVVETDADAESAFEADALITQAAVRDVFALLVEELKTA